MNLSLLLLWQLSLCLHAHATSNVADSHPEAPPEYNAQVDNGTFGYYPERTYATEDELASPQTNFLQWDPRCSDGNYYFLSPRGWSLPTPGPMILDNVGELVWTKHFANKFGGQAYDFKVQTYYGEQYLTFWLGDDRVRGHGSGFYYMLNSSYDIVHRVGAANGLFADLHEFLITPEGTALMTMYEVTQSNITGFPGYTPDPENLDAPTYIWDCLFQEINIETGTLIFEWRASDYIAVDQTYRAIEEGGSEEDPFDWFHINSIQKDDLGNYLISARFTHSIMYIDGVTGDIIWTLGGQSNNFVDLSGGNALNFAWQHDARFIPVDTFPNMHYPSTPPDGFITTLLTLFDNAAADRDYDYGAEQARGLLLELTYPIPDGYKGLPNGARNTPHNPCDTGKLRQARASRPMGEGDDVDLQTLKMDTINGTNLDFTARLIKAYDNPEGLRSSSQGSVQILHQSPEEDPRVLVGFGLNAILTEYTADGTVLCNVHYGANISWERGDIQSYRVYKFPWYGDPETQPKLEISDDDTEVYVSWNGATEVTHWILQCAESDSDLEDDWADVVQVKKRGFETLIPMPEEVGDLRYLRIIALDRNGRRFEYGTSEIIDRGAAASFFPTAENELPLEATSLTPLKIVFVMVCNVAVIVVLFEIYRRYLSWRAGRPSSGAVRWRQDGAYRLLSD